MLWTCYRGIIILCILLFLSTGFNYVLQRKKKGSSLNEYRRFAQYMESDFKRSLGFPDVYS